MPYLPHNEASPYRVRACRGHHHVYVGTDKDGDDINTESGLYLSRTQALDEAAILNAEYQEQGKK